MAEQGKVDVVIGAIDEASATIGKVAAALAALYGAYKLVEEGISEAAKHEDAETRLAAAVGQVSEALAGQATAMSHVTRYRDDEITAVQGTIASYVRNIDQIQRLTKAAADMAAARNVDLNTAAFLLTKTFESNMNAMARWGIQVNGTAQSAERLESILRAVEERFGGQAEAQANTYSGVLTNLKKSFEKLMEAFGDIIVKNPAVVLVMKILTGEFYKLGKSVNENQVFLRGLVKDGILFMIDTLRGAIYAVGSLHMAWEYMKVGVTQIITWIAQGLEFFWESMRTWVLEPLDWLFQSLVKLGMMDENPFDAVSMGLKKFTEFEKEALKGTLDHAEVIRQRYWGVIAYINKLSEAVEKVDVTKPTTPAEDAASITKNITKSTTIRQALLDDRYKADLAMAQTYGEKSLELQKAQDVQFMAEVQKQYEQYSIEKMNEVELDFFIQTVKEQIAARDIAREKKKAKDMAAIGDSMAQQKAELAKAQYGEQSPEYQNAADTAFYSSLGNRYQALLDSGAQEAELTAAYEQLKTEIIVREAQKRQTMEQNAYQQGKQALNNFMQFAQLMAARQGTDGRKYFTMYKIAASARAAIDTGEAAIAAYKAMVGIPIVGPALAVAAAAAAVAFGIAQIQNIQRQSYDSMGTLGSSGAGGSVSVSTPPVTAAPAPIGSEAAGAGNVTVYLTVNNPIGNEDWEQIAENYVVPAINRNGDRGVTIQQNVVATA